MHLLVSKIALQQQFSSHQVSSLALPNPQGLLSLALVPVNNNKEGLTEIVS